MSKALLLLLTIAALFDVCRGQVRLVHGSGATGLQLVQSYSDSDEDSDGAWEGRLGDRYNPPGRTKLEPFKCGQSFNLTLSACLNWC